jgi:osmoprotectant transport system substrate-binding protein
VVTTADLTSLNKQVDSERMKPEDVAWKYLQPKGLLSG